MDHLPLFPVVSPIFAIGASTFSSSYRCKTHTFINSKFILLEKGQGGVGVIPDTRFVLNSIRDKVSSILPHKMIPTLMLRVLVLMYPSFTSPKPNIKLLLDSSNNNLLVLMVLVLTSPHGQMSPK
ncbi:hypothetical protein ACSQ67_009146 [Phaseolus vulgaris]